MYFQFFLSTFKHALQELFPDKPAFTKADFKVIVTATFGRTPSDAEVNATFQMNDLLPISRIEGIIRNLVYLKRKDLSIDAFSVLDLDFKGYFDEGDVRRVWEAVAKRLEWKVVLRCFRDLCPDGKMSYLDFGMVCHATGLGKEYGVLGDGQCENMNAL